MAVAACQLRACRPAGTAQVSTCEKVTEGHRRSGKVGESLRRSAKASAVQRKPAKANEAVDKGTWIPDTMKEGSTRT